MYTDNSTYLTINGLDVIVFQFITETACLVWKYNNANALIGKRHWNCETIVYQGWANECPEEYRDKIVFHGKDYYLLILRDYGHPTRRWTVVN